VEFNRERAHDETLALLELAYELGVQADQVVMASSAALQTAEVAAYMGAVTTVRTYLGNASIWTERAKSSDSIGAERESWWVNLRANWLATKGRALVTLTEHCDLTDLAAAKTLEEAFEALKEGQQFTLEHREHLHGELDLFLAQLHYWWGVAALQLNRFDEAVDLFRTSRSDAAIANLRYAADLGVRSRLLEAQALMLAGRLQEAHEGVTQLLGDALVTEIDRAEAESVREYLESRLLPVVEWFASPQGQSVFATSKKTGVRVAIAQQVAPLVAWWKDWEGEDRKPQSALLDIWGRGGFARLAAAIRAHPHTVVSTDARSMAEIARWARILCPLFDTVLIRWKGELSAGGVLAPFPTDWGGPGSFGGWGYSIAAGSRIEHRGGVDDWCPALGWANLLPPEVGEFLATAALRLVQSGRLVVLPGPLAGCTQSAVGWTDNLLVDGFLGGVVDVVSERPGGTRATGRQRVLDLSALQLPYIDGVTLPNLAGVLEETDDWLFDLRSLLLRRTLHDDLRHERWQSIAALEHDIRNSCKELRRRLERFASSHDWRVAEVNASLSAGSRGGDERAHEPVTDLLRSIASAKRELAPWIPYWRLSTVGGYLDWSCPIDNPSTPSPKPEEPRQIHSWLYPGNAGWRIPTEQRVQ
jgi:hypothetical protein